MDTLTEEEYWADAEMVEAQIEVDPVEVDEQSEEKSDTRQRLKVTRKLTGGWSGVRGCNSRSRAQAELDKKYHAFLKDVIYEHRHMRLIDSGASMEGWRYRNGRRPFPDNSRYCHGNLVGAKAWALFEA